MCEIETCKRKRTYLRKKSAKLAARGIKAVGYAIQVPYRCPVCGGFHLTTKRKRTTNDG